MMSISKTCNSIFQLVIDDYHLQDFVDAIKSNPYNSSNSFEKMIYDKCWIDTIPVSYTHLTLPTILLV